MKEILLLNPSKRRKKRATKKRKTKRRATKRTTNQATRMASRKGTTSMARKKRRTTRRIKRNPTRKRKIARRASGSFRGLIFKSALKNIPLNTFGMFAAKWAAKKFGTSATETDPTTWNYASYLKGAAGAAAAGFLANMLRAGTGQRVLEGGMSLMLYKLVQNELIPNSTFWTGQLGAEEEEEGYSPGDVETDSSGEPYILGDDMSWYPLSGEEDTGMYGEERLVTPGPLGDALLTPGPLGATEDIDNMMVRSFLVR